MLPQIGGLRSKLVLLVLFAALPGFAIALMSNIRERELFESRYREKALRISQQAVIRQDELVSETRTALEQLSEKAEVRGAQCESILLEQLKRSERYLVFATIGIDGKSICTAPPTKQAIDVRDRSWFQRTIRDRDFAAGEYQIGRISNQPGLAFSYPLITNNQLQGVIVATLNLNWLNQLIAAKELPAGSTVSVVDRKGVILARYPEPEKWVGTSIKNTDLFKELQTQRTNSTTIQRGADGNLQLFAYSYLLPQEAPDLRLIVSIPESEIFAQATRNTIENLIWLGTIAIFAIIATWYFSVIAIQRPICRLLDATQQLTKGDLSVRVEPPFQPGMLGQLAQAFNQMARSLESHVAEKIEIQRQSELAQIKERFVSMVTHEFRNPLSSILVAAQILRQYGDRMSATQKDQQFERLVSAARQMQQLMEDVLLIGQDQAGMVQFAPTTVNLDEFCGGLIEEAQGNATSQHRLVLTHEGNCQGMNIDERLVRSILTNLLSNAIKYSPEGGTVDFRLRCEPECLIFQIQDSGIGISEEDLPRLFESFYRGQNTGRIRGTGLGLAIVKRCVELHGGTIAVDSQIDVGTTFEVRLPQ
ncbi:PAS/PAC sensor signal transduction histidine kinase [Leptolyngbya sp. NIES-3755]|nr:PAS/PAC sensor signal transduction histidine kinase [Leptolyngbya sp. NIES-3755]